MRKTAFLFVAACLIPGGTPLLAKTKPTLYQAAAIVELFTSQGCSSCPAADSLLSRLGESLPVIALAYHVDYWNALGWRDPFSNPSYSQRQRRYAKVLPSHQVYTPQAIINGRKECVGSDERCIREAVAEVGNSTVGIKLEISAQWTAEKKIRLGLRGVRTAEAFARKPLQLIAVFYEQGLQTDVARGENAGRVLLNDYVVRAFDPLLTLSSAQEIAQETFLLTPKAHWNSQRLGLVVLLQDPSSMEIITAAILGLLQ